MNTSACETSARYGNNTDKAGPDSAKHLSSDQYLGEVPVNTESRISDHSEKFPILGRANPRANLVCPAQRVLNLLQPLSLVDGRADFYLYRQTWNQAGGRFIAVCPHEDRHPPAPVQRLLAQGEQLPEPGRVVPYVDQQQEIVRVGL